MQLHGVIQPTNQTDQTDQTEMKTSLKKIAAAAILASISMATVAGQGTIQEAARAAVTSSPEVISKLQAFSAARLDVGIAKAGWLPRIDLLADVGRNTDDFGSSKRSLSSSSVSLSVTQLLWDGLATRSEVSRLGHASLVRYFELLQAGDSVALEAIRAGIDVARQRELVRLATENLNDHQALHDKVVGRVTQGVARGVEQDQAAGRLALAKANLATETSNLHDVTERYIRIVGETPPANMDMAELDVAMSAGLPASDEAAINNAVLLNPAIAASIENLRALQDQGNARRALAYQPRIELQGRADTGRNIGSTQDLSRAAHVGLTVRWNLFAGGADQARVQQAAKLITQAASLRDKSCRDVRQTAAIAHQDISKLGQQIELTGLHAASAASVLRVYQQQFDIAQPGRSLLDVLNAQNEQYSAVRANMLARYDQVLAKARTHAAQGSLIPALGMSRTSEDTPAEVNNWNAGEDAPTRCPLAPTEIVKR